MNDDGLEAGIYAFEALWPGLESPPIAARRALDHAGLRLSLDGWRSLSRSMRVELARAGSGAAVDTARVRDLLAAASPASLATPPRADPDDAAPPELLLKALPPGLDLSPSRWAALTALDRYALVHAHRQAVARSAFSGLAEIAASILAAAPVHLHPESSPSPPSPSLPLSSHLTDAGEVRMVDVGDKPATERRAVARGVVRMRRETLDRLASHTVPKGEVLATARLAGIMAAKRTPELIPLCHSVALTHVEVALHLAERDGQGVVTVTASVDARDRTGCEMEALLAVSAACLTVYDMLKGIDREMTVTDIMLLEKSGGRSGRYQRSG